jgi:hypothetical protein
MEPAAGYGRVHLVCNRENSILPGNRNTAPSFMHWRFLNPSREVVKQFQEPALFDALRKVVRTPILLVGGPLSDRNLLRFDHRPVRQIVTFERVANCVKMLARKTVLCMVWASACLFVQVNLIHLLRIRLAWNDPSSVGGLFQLAGSGDDKTTLFASVHQKPLKSSGVQMDTLCLSGQEFRRSVAMLAFGKHIMLAYSMLDMLAFGKYTFFDRLLKSGEHYVETEKDQG